MTCHYLIISVKPSADCQQLVDSRRLLGKKLISDIISYFTIRIFVSLVTVVEWSMWCIIWGTILANILLIKMNTNIAFISSKHTVHCSYWRLHQTDLSSLVKSISASSSVFSSTLYVLVNSRDILGVFGGPMAYPSQKKKEE